MNKIIAGIIIAVVILGLGILGISRLNEGLSQTVKPVSSISPTETGFEEISPTPPVSTSEAANVELIITVTASGFMPKTATIRRGTKVTWINKSGNIANVSSAVHPTHLVYPPFNLGNFAAEESVSLTFDTAGTYRYHDHLVPANTGTIVVEE